MKNYLFLVLATVMSCIVIGCSSPQSLPFTMAEKSMAFPYKNTGSELIPELVVLTSSQEITSSLPGVELTDNILDYLRHTDFDQTFVILLQVGQNPDKVEISQIVRRNDEVIISISNYSVGPGNYILPDFTPPYMLIAVEKNDKWNKDILFTVSTETQEVIGTITHFVP